MAKETVLYDHKGRPYVTKRVAGKLVVEQATGTALADIQTRYPRLHARDGQKGYVRHGHSSIGQFGDPWQKTAQGSMADVGTSSFPSFSGRTTTTSPEVRNPLLNIVNFYLPTNYKVLNQWLRYYDRFHPIVGNLMDLNSSFPMSDYSLVGVDDERALEKYEMMKDLIQLPARNVEVNREVELLGETYPYARFDDEQGIFDQVAIVNPDNIVVRDSPLAYGNNLQIEYEPDEALFALVHSQDPRDREIVANLDPMIVWAVLNGSTIQLDPFNCRQIARKASPYDPRGTPILLRALKELLYEDKLREMQYAIADSKIYPKEIWKLGDENWIPSDDELNDFRKLLSDAAHDPVFSIVTHRGVDAIFEGAAGKVLPLTSEIDWVEKRVMIALHGAPTMFGEGGPYATANTVFAIIQARFQARRRKIWEWNRYLYEQVALFHGFWKRSEAELKHGVRVANKPRELDVPVQCEWTERLNLVEDPQRTLFYQQMRARMEISYETYAKHVGLDPVEEKERLKREEGSVTDPLYQQRRQLAEQVDQQQAIKELIPEMTPDELQHMTDQVGKDWEIQTTPKDTKAPGVKAPGTGRTTPKAVTKAPGAVPGGKPATGSFWHRLSDAVRGSPK